MIKKKKTGSRTQKFGVRILGFMIQPYIYILYWSISSLLSHPSFQEVVYASGLHFLTCGSHKSIDTQFHLCHLTESAFPSITIVPFIKSDLTSPEYLVPLTFPTYSKLCGFFVGFPVFSTKSLSLSLSPSLSGFFPYFSFPEISLQIFSVLLLIL